MLLWMDEILLDLLLILGLCVYGLILYAQAEASSWISIVGESSTCTVDGERQLAS